MNKFFTIKNKLNLATMIIVVVTLLFSLGSLHSLERKSIEENETHKAISVAKFVSENNQASLYFNDKEAATVNLSFMRNLKFIDAACIFSEDGDLFSKYEVNKGLCSSGESYGNSKYTVIEKILVDELEIGYLKLIVNESSLKERDKKLIINFISTFFIALIFSLMLISVVHKAIANPISDLSILAKKISSTDDYSIRASSTKDYELNSLIEAFNKMLKTIEGKSKDLFFQANYDVLTNKLNRRGLIYKADYFFESKSLNVNSCLMFIDVDNFKYINDSYGYSIGDDVLKWVSSMVEEYLPDTSLISRFGGDEFCVLLEEPSDNLPALSQGLCDFFKNNCFSRNGMNINVTCSVGVAIYDGLWNRSEWIKSANVACFIAKRRGKSQAYIYDVNSDESEEYLRSGLMVQKIKDALKNDGFILYKQKICNPFFEKGPCKYEILLRLNYEGEIFSPKDFLEVAEKNDLIKDIDRYVIDKTFKFMSDNPKAVDDIDWFSINLSGSSLSDESFSDYVISKLEEYSILPVKVIFEITETSIIDKMDVAIKIVDRLIEKDFGFTLDDFGSGLSSFEYLRSFNVGQIKIDGMFVKDIVENEKSYIMVKSINDLAKSLNKSTVAEFVENIDIANALKDIGVDFMQGYWVEKPSPL